MKDNSIFNIDTEDHSFVIREMYKNANEAIARYIALDEPKRQPTEEEAFFAYFLSGGEVDWSMEKGPNGEDMARAVSRNKIGAHWNGEKIVVSVMLGEK